MRPDLRAAIVEFLRVWSERFKYHFDDRELVAAVRTLRIAFGAASADVGLDQ